MDVHDLLEQVADRDSFLKFVHALMMDRAEAAHQEKTRLDNVYNGPINSWQNTTIESYLEAALAWANGGLGAEPSWKDFAIFLYCGKIYE